LVACVLFLALRERLKVKDFSDVASDAKDCRIIRGLMQKIFVNFYLRFSLAVFIACCISVGCMQTETTGNKVEVSQSVETFEDIKDEALGLPRIVVLGDSLTAGYGLYPEEAFPARLQQRLQLSGYQFEVVNAGVSGDTTAGGLRRLHWALEGDVRILIVALGGNDGLRGLPVEQMKDNLSEIVTIAASQGIKVLLAGMRAPPNFGSDYTKRFYEVFLELHEENDLLFVPFLLEGVARVPELNQMDGIHPNSKGADRVAAYLWSFLATMLPVVEVSVH